MVPSAAGTTISPSRIAELALMCQASSSDLLESVGPVVAPPGEDVDRLVMQMDLHPIAVELDFVNPSGSGRHLLDRGCQGRFDEIRKRRLLAKGGAGFLR